MSYRDHDIVAVRYKGKIYCQPIETAEQLLKNVGAIRLFGFRLRIKDGDNPSRAAAIVMSDWLYSGFVSSKVAGDFMDPDYTYDFETEEWTKI